MASSTSPGAGVASYVGTLFSINATEAGPKDPLAEDQFEIRESCELNFFLNNLYDVGFCCLKTCGEGGWIVAPFSGGGGWRIHFCTVCFFCCCFCIIHTFIYIITFTNTWE